MHFLCPYSRRISSCSLTWGLAMWLFWSMEYYYIWQTRVLYGWAWAFPLCQGCEKNIPGVADGSTEDENHICHNPQQTHRPATKFNLAQLIPDHPDARERNLMHEKEISDAVLLLLLCIIIVAIEGYSSDCLPQCWALSRSWIKICGTEPNWKCVYCLYGTFRERPLLKGPNM